jgi:hypothetical protein
MYLSTAHPKVFTSFTLCLSFDIFSDIEFRYKNLSEAFNTLIGLQLCFCSSTDIPSEKSEVRISAIIGSDIKVVGVVSDDPELESLQETGYPCSAICFLLSLYPSKSRSQFLLFTPFYTLHNNLII